MNNKRKDIEEIEASFLDKAVADYLSIYEGVELAENLIWVSECFIYGKLEELEEMLKEEEITRLVLEIGNSVRESWLMKKDDDFRQAFLHSFATNIISKRKALLSNKSSALAIDNIRNGVANSVVEIKKDSLEDRSLVYKIRLIRNWEGSTSEYKMLIIENIFGAVVDEMTDCVKMLFRSEKRMNIFKLNLKWMLSELSEEEMNNQDLVLEKILERTMLFFNKKDLRSLFELIAQKNLGISKK